MTAIIIDGRKLAQQVQQDAAREVKNLAARDITPGLAVVLVGKEHASTIYVRRKRKVCEKLGIASFAHDFPAETATKRLIRLIHELNVDKRIHGILVQLPLPAHIDAASVLQAVDPAKDVDGFHPINAGRLMIGEPCLKPCTPAGVMKMIDELGDEIRGKHAVVIGRSAIVGKPAALMLLERHATVTICHSRTEHIAEVVRGADIVVAAVGKPRFVRGDWIKDGAVVIDVGINRLDDGSLAGDVDFEAAARRAAAITPVPGGVGPMTIAMLMSNTIQAARALTRQPAREREDV